MIKLSDRLQAIANMVNPGETVADIGTDHGFLPISLWEKGISPHVILSDIKKGPLEKARENISKHCPEEDFDIRLGGGLATLNSGEADVIVIAGMGGQLIAEILSEKLTIARSAKRLIFQPRNSQNKLRKWLCDNDFNIVDEVLVREGKYICEVIAAEPNNSQDRKDQWEHDQDQQIDELNYEISPIIFQKKDPLLVEFIRNKIRIENKIIKDIRNGIRTDEHEKLRNSQERISKLQAMLERSGKF